MKSKTLIRQIKEYNLNEVETFVREAVTLFGGALLSVRASCRP